jgi:hypothetical protein
VNEFEEKVLTQLKNISDSLAQLAASNRPAEPNYRFPFKDFFNFDWGRIGAKVIQSDEYGPSTVEWNGHANWTRRYAGETRTRKASVWFSRAAAAEDAESGVQWYTLITFRDMAAAEPMTGIAPPQKPATRPQPAQPEPTPQPAPAQPKQPGPAVKPSFFMPGDEVVVKGDTDEKAGEVVEDGGNGKVRVKIGEKVFSTDRERLTLIPKQAKIIADQRPARTNYDSES